MGRELLSIIATVVVAPIAITCGLLYWWTTRSRVTVRPATPDDVWFMRRTYNRNRDWFGNTEYVGKDEHKDWYDKLLCDPDSLVLIGMVGSNRAGYIRVQNDTLSYCVSKRYRGLGVASMMLRHVLFQRSKLSATVMFGNVASRRLLEKHGFERTYEPNAQKFVTYTKGYVY
jgi:ribosomal protein S18 acetylase RimI-like enzyme